MEDETSEKVKLDTKEEKSPRFIEDDEGVLCTKEGFLCLTSRN
jgi:hypothetical protein